MFCTPGLTLLSDPFPLAIGTWCGCGFERRFWCEAKITVLGGERRAKVFGRHIGCGVLQ